MCRISPIRKNEVRENPIPKSMTGIIFCNMNSGNYFRIDSEYLPLQKGYMCTEVILDDDGNIEQELSTGFQTRKEVEMWIDFE